jgi:hypothetical protein
MKKIELYTAYKNEAIVAYKTALNWSVFNYTEAQQWTEYAIEMDKLAEQVQAMSYADFRMWLYWETVAANTPELA